MNFDEFRQASKRTMRFEPEHRANAALGLVGEIGEWLAAESIPKRLEEAGDSLFYLAWLCDFYHVVPYEHEENYRLHVLEYAAEVADMVKKHTFHDKEPDYKSLASALSNIYNFFASAYPKPDELINIYQANIAKLLIRHPIDKGYTNEGQNMRADEIVKHAQSGNAEQTAAQCEGKTASQTLHDNTQALAAALGNAKQALSNVVNSLLVKNTADELPDESVIVLLWHDSQWMPVMRNSTMEWDFAYDAYVISKVTDGQYWQPMPSFNPEREA